MDYQISEAESLLLLTILVTILWISQSSQTTQSKVFVWYVLHDWHDEDKKLTHFFLKK